MSNKDQQPLNGHFPPEWGIDPEEVKAQIRRCLSSSRDIFTGELEDHTDEVLQETVRRYLRRANEKDDTPIREPRKYILKIAQNVCVEFFKKGKKKLEREVRLPLPNEQESEDSSYVELIPDEWGQPEQILLSKEEFDRILALIDQLPQPLRDVIRLKAEGAPLREIARRTSMSLTDVSVCLQEGQKELQQLLHQ
jgi:RNA polymerase sigma factor (sigma-70 family)